ncbi:hypothetical protein OKA05_19780 [Luteolibacter arcticus]|uniref:Uncharacterized protein n=1 Tax=Luteolibacter arcticus TaxID=1581411 RepID=A0ABT3GMT0_9BACT|nr:hypothetical protein [Luteolibacter arcticus]MCW1924814.1 hypothetical protein [Luteolibacter arcticus]
MKITLLKWCRLAAMGLAGLAMCHALQAAELLNGGFDNGKTNWTGTFKAGNAGGNGWGTNYFSNSYPTDSTFATSVDSTIKQTLSGAANTFVEGTTYTLSMSIFGANNWATGAPVLWSLGFTADGSLLATDHWFSEEFSASTVGAGNGGTIPDDHITTVGPGSTGLRTVTFSYTATAADVGKVIGVQLGGNTQTKYTLAAGAPTPGAYYGMMDSVTFSSSSASLRTFTSDLEVLDGNGFYLNWSIEKPELIGTLTLNSGSGPLDVKPDTDLETGEGFIFVNPTVATTYTLLLNGSQQGQVTVHAGKALTLTKTARVAIAPSYQVTLNWSVQPVGASVSLSDGFSSIDVTADTDPETGLGSKQVTVPNPSTIFTLSANGSPLVVSTRVLRETSNTAAFSINSASIINGQPITVTWTGAAAAEKDWIGIYAVGETPGIEYADAWNYLSGNRTPAAGFTDGSMSFTLPVGDYYAVLLLNDGYDIAQGPILFSVVEPPPVDEPIKVTSINKGANSVSLVWESKAGVAYDIYASDSLQGDPLVDWDEVSLALPSDGDDTTDFTETFESGAPGRRFYKIYEVPATP